MEAMEVLAQVEKIDRTTRPTPRVSTRSLPMSGWPRNGSLPPRALGVGQPRAKEAAGANAQAHARARGAVADAVSSKEATDTSSGDLITHD